MPAYYRADFDEFAVADRDTVFAALLRRAAEENLGPQYQEQVQVWDEQLPILKATIEQIVDEIPGAIDWTVLLEFPIPRMRRRIDCVILGAGTVFVIEFKSHTEATSADRRQVEEYCLDLRDFHEGCVDRDIVPILVTGAGAGDRVVPRTANVERGLVCTDTTELAGVIIRHTAGQREPVIDGMLWDTAAYKPVPTIIEAATMMFSGHGVRDIGHAHASAENLTITSEHLVQTVLRARAEGRHVMCFVTGVPGAGKTLTGLNVVHDPRLGGLGADRGEGATYLSGNGPLVKVLREALARDEAERENLTKNEARRHASRAIQNVHDFIWDSYERDEAPWEHAVIFDEAQRAWDSGQVNRKRRVELSEPELIAGIMERHRDWAVVIGLVGGGQEIHDGEAGLQGWGNAVLDSAGLWEIEVSPEMVTGDAVGAGATLFPDGAPPGLTIQAVDALHLPVPLRTFRADAVASWVDHVLAGESEAAAADMASLGDYPMVMTRSLEEARGFLVSHKGGERRYGLVASSGAKRLKAWGIDVGQDSVREIAWFLNPPEDVRSCFSLENVATEFDIQGLELDFIGLCWGGDLTWDSRRGSWRYRDLLHRPDGTRWCYKHDSRHSRVRQYMLNKYRVLLTRAREAVVIWVPPKRPDDPTIDGAFFDETSDYLRACGVSEL